MTTTTATATHDQGCIDHAGGAVMDEWYGTERENATTAAIDAEALRYVTEGTVECVCS